MFTEESFAEIAAFQDDLMAQAAQLAALGDAGDKKAADKLGVKLSEAILRRHPFEVAAMLLSTACDLARAEAKIKDLEASIASWNDPEQLPDNETTRAIGHFLAHPETGVRRAMPARRGGMTGVQIGHGGTQTNVFNENGSDHV